MNRVEFALRQFRKLAKLPPGVDDPHAVRNRRLWLTDDVAPAVADYILRPKFRALAIWPITALGGDVDGPERRRILQLEAALTRWAQALRRLHSKRQIQAALSESKHATSGFIELPPVWIGAGQPTRYRSDFSAASGEFSFSGIADIANEGHVPLANPQDYFGPQPEFIDLPDGETIQRGEAIVEFSPQLHAIGNFVVRAFFRRTESFLRVLRLADRQITQAIRQVKTNYKDRPIADDARRTVQTLVESLQADWLYSSAAKQRDSCVILTQIYAAFHPVPELAWLGLPSEGVDFGIASLRRRVTSRLGTELCDRVATALSDLLVLYQDEPE